MGVFLILAGIQTTFGGPPYQYAGVYSSGGASHHPSWPHESGQASPRFSAGGGEQSAGDHRRGEGGRGVFGAAPGVAKERHFNSPGGSLGGGSATSFFWGVGGCCLFIFFSLFFFFWGGGAGRVRPIFYEDGDFRSGYLFGTILNSLGGVIFVV